MAMLPAPPLPAPDEEAPPDQGMIVPIVAGLTRAEIKDTRTDDVLRMTLGKMSHVQLPPIHDYPAPPAEPSQGDPTLSHTKPWTVQTVGLRASYLDRFLNSTVGRFAIFCVCLICVNVAILGLSGWNSPQNRRDGSALTIFILCLMLFLVTFTMPLLSERAGMSSKDTGWKPWLVLYRMAFVCAIPACVLQTLGTGEKVAFGNTAGEMGVVKVEGLQNRYWDYFELSDGFVALNLTKGVTETLVAEEHGVKKHRRVSRFRDAELRINVEPYSDEVEPTETPGRIATYRIAPIFSNWAPCLARYRMSTSCLTQNPIRAWAVSKSTSLCASQRSVGCKPPKPELEPVYQCSKNHNGSSSKGIRGVNRTEPIEGLCGHVGLPPPDGAIDELSALLLYDAWPKISLPTPESLWLDVSPDQCINQLASCEAQWKDLHLAGLVFQVLTNLLVLIPMYMDCRMDSRLRSAQKYYAEQELKENRKEFVDEKYKKATVDG